MTCASTLQFIGGLKSQIEFVIDLDKLAFDVKSRPRERNVTVPFSVEPVPIRRESIRRVRTTLMMPLAVKRTANE